jgi:dUTP pyrophosphatase
MKLRVNIKKLSENAIIPSYQTPGSSGFDFHAIEDMEIDPRKTALVKTGLSMEIPEGYELQVRPRSGMSLKTKIRVANSPGTVDSKN